MKQSAFPTTHATELRTLVDAALADAGTDARVDLARRTLMERYAEPLAVFVRGSSLARLGEPAEVVNGYFVARLSDSASVVDFLSRWARSGMRLRRWMMNGILFYGQGLARDRARWMQRNQHVEGPGLELREGPSATGEDDFERAWALAVVREATARAEQALLDEGRSDDFEIFRRHAIDGQPYAAFAAEVERTAQQCAGATRLVAQRVRAALTDLLREEGLDESEIDGEIARIQRVLADSPRR